MTRNPRTPALAILLLCLGACGNRSSDQVAAVPPPVSDDLEQACLAAVAQETNNSVTLLSNDYGRARSTIMIGVGRDNAPWRCRVTNSGEVIDIMSTVDEGGL